MRVRAVTDVRDVVRPGWHALPWTAPRAVRCGERTRRSIPIAGISQRDFGREEAEAEYQKEGNEASGHDEEYIEGASMSHFDHIGPLFCTAFEHASEA